MRPQPVRFTALHCGDLMPALVLPQSRVSGYLLFFGTTMSLMKYNLHPATLAVNASVLSPEQPDAQSNKSQNVKSDGLPTREAGN
jgi:hypothetical protein